MNKKMALGIALCIGLSGTAVLGKVKHKKTCDVKRAALITAFVADTGIAAPTLLGCLVSLVMGGYAKYLACTQALGIELGVAGVLAKKWTSGACEHVSSSIKIKNDSEHDLICKFESTKPGCRATHAFGQGKTEKMGWQCSSKRNCCQDQQKHPMVKCWWKDYPKDRPVKFCGKDGHKTTIHRNKKHRTLSLNSGNKSVKKYKGC